MSHSTIPAIYVACLASYNNAILHGRWIEVTDEYIVVEQIKEMLADSPEEDAEEYAIHGAIRSRI